MSTHRAPQSVPPDRAVLRVAVSAGRAGRQEGVGRLPRGPEPRGSAPDAVRLLQRDRRPGTWCGGERPEFSRREEARRLSPQPGHGPLVMFPQAGEIRRSVLQYFSVVTVG